MALAGAGGAAGSRQDVQHQQEGQCDASVDFTVNIHCIYQQYYHETNDRSVVV